MEAKPKVKIGCNEEVEFIKFQEAATKLILLKEGDNTIEKSLGDCASRTLFLATTAAEIEPTKRIKSVKKNPDTN